MKIFFPIYINIMFINNLDTLLEEILNKFNVYLEEKNLNKKISKRTKFC